MKFIGVFVFICLLAGVCESIVSGDDHRTFATHDSFFHCDGSRSLEIDQHCDGLVDCDDKSDERDCEYDACILKDELKFTCHGGKECILRDFRCDGSPDCPDGSDELDCSTKMSCQSHWFACKDGTQCIPRSFQCDGHPECKDKSDESDCHGILHGYSNCRNRFSCGFGLCLEDERLVCDGKKDCPDGSDESSETCSSHADCTQCSQHCLRHSGGATCKCHSGFELAKDGFTCHDIDECALNLCSQGCMNTEGSFKCLCGTGFDLVNGTMCENKNKATLVWYRGYASRSSQIILERAGQTQKYDIPEIENEAHVSRIIMPPMSLDIDNEKLYIRLTNSLHVLDLKVPQPVPVPVVPPHIEMSDFAVDFATGNVYFTTLGSNSLSVCQFGRSCMPLIPRRSEVISRIQIARLASGPRIFWKEGSRIMSITLDGLEISQIYRISDRKKMHYFTVDEQNHKLYVAQADLIEVDLSTLKARSLANLDFGEESYFFWNMAVLDDTVLIQVMDTKTMSNTVDKMPTYEIFKINRVTGDHLGKMDVHRKLQLHSVRRTSEHKPQNPCFGDPCSHTCVPGSSSAWYKCLCPPGMYLDEENERQCILQQGHEQVFFVNGSSFSTYVYEDDVLYHNQDIDLRVVPSAIASNLDMNLIYSTHQGLFAFTKDGTLKEYGWRLRDIRSMVLDPVDDVLYAVNDIELLVVNLRTSTVALISENVDIIHIDIDPLQRILFVETRDSKLFSMVIGTWDRVFLDHDPEPSHDGQKTWAFDPFDSDIRTDVSLVLSKGYCDLVHEDDMGFDCQRHGRLVPRCNHTDHETRLLARSGPTLTSYSGTACESSTCDFCVTAPGVQAVCVCPYGHETGADGKSCSQKCGTDMLRCSAADKKCIHKTRRCDGFEDCPDGSDEKNCDQHDCRDNFKCVSNGVCVNKKFVCDGQNDCLDSSDEVNCPPRNCTAAHFKCEDQTCIELHQKCDGVNDCFHGEDERNCPKVLCRPDQFDCGNNRCISKEWICDTHDDCPNGEDETNCPSLLAVEGILRNRAVCDPSKYFCCGSGERLSLKMRCNGFPECKDRSDEHNCTLPCEPPQFRCSNGACLQESEVCDGIVHCTDAADEHVCKGKCKLKDLFECSDGTCIAQGKVCDGNKDCFGGEDETEACNLPPPVNKTCYADEFRCDSGQCIYLGQVCDGKKHCSDGSDEGKYCGDFDCGKAGCSQTCFAGFHGVRCSCHVGYRLMEDGYSCADIDECIETPEVCSQYCENQKGSYSCSCAPGFVMNAQGECRVEKGDPIVLVVENGVVEAIHKNRDRALVFDSHGSGIGGIEYDIVTGLVFVSDTKNNKVHRIPLNTSEIQFNHEVYTQMQPGVLALDWVTENLYYADHRPSIHVCTRFMAGAYCTLLIEVNVKSLSGLPPSITSIALVPDEGIMFYSESETGFIFRQNMDGTDKSPFVWEVRLKRPLSLTVDHVHRTLYWIDAHTGSLESSDLKGEKIRRVAAHLNFVQTFAIYEDYVLFPEPEQEHWVIMHKLTGKIKSSKHSPLGRLNDIKIMHRVNQPHEVNRCHKNKCQQMCLLRPHGFACACKDGQEISNDNLTCVDIAFNNSDLFDEKLQQKLLSECSCENGGQCSTSKMSNKSFYCKCPPGYHGDRCELGPTKSLVLTVITICLFFILVAAAGVFLIILAAKRDRLRKGASGKTHEGSDRRNLIDEDAEDCPSY